MSNYIAVEDVAEYAVRILLRDDVVNEVVEVGGPDNMAMRDVLTLAEQALGIQAKRRHIPLWVLHYMPTVIRPFNEVAARFMNLGYWSETTPKRFDGWRAPAERFGVMPMTVQEFVKRSVQKAPP